jgi:hypothetical protein
MTSSSAPIGHGPNDSPMSQLRSITIGGYQAEDR